MAKRFNSWLLLLIFFFFLSMFVIDLRSEFWMQFITYLLLNIYILYMNVFRNREFCINVVGFFLQ